MTTSAPQVAQTTAEVENLPAAKICFVSWAPYCSRSDSIARRLGGESHMIYAANFGSRYATILLKYIVQTIKTFWLLLKKRPRLVLVMAPPVIACVPVWFYCLSFRARFIIDAHTGAFLDPRWQRVLFFQKFFSRRASATIVTNAYLRDIVQGWKANVIIVPDVPVAFAEPSSPKLPEGLNVMVVSSFCPDEPIAEIFDAARQHPQIHFHMTGNSSKMPKELLERRPDNVRLTGFISDQEYVGLLLASDAVLAITTRDHTMQRGAYEAIYAGRPVITSDFQLLRESFPQATVHVQPTAAGIAQGVGEMRDHLERYTAEAAQLKAAKINQWHQNAGKVRAFLNG